MPDPEDWLAQTEDLSKPETAPENWDVTTQYICVRPYDNRLVGMIQVRHTLNPYLALYGGHVSFSVHPAELDEVLLACDPAWAAGKRVIEKNGGVFAEKVFDPEYETDVERYRIALK